MARRWIQGMGTIASGVLLYLWAIKPLGRAVSRYPVLIVPVLGWIFYQAWGYPVQISSLDGIVEDVQVIGPRSTSWSQGTVISIQTSPGTRHPHMASLAVVCVFQQAGRLEGIRLRLSEIETPQGWQSVGHLPRGTRLRVMVPHTQPLRYKVQRCTLGADAQEAWKHLNIISDGIFHTVPYDSLRSS